MVRQYKPKNPARKSSKISEGIYSGVLRCFIMGLNPREVADLLPISIQSARKLFKQFRDDLSCHRTQFYFAAFVLLDAHWPGEPIGGTMGALKLMSAEMAPVQEDVLRIYQCIMSCPMSLPPKRLKRALDIEATIRKPTLLNPTPIAHGEQSEFHNRKKCSNCVFPNQRGQIAYQFLNAVAMKLAYYRNLSRQEFGEYFFYAALSSMMDQYFFVVQNGLIEQELPKDEIYEEANKKYRHVLEAISKLAFEVLSGRKLIWRDMDEDGSSGLEGLY